MRIGIGRAAPAESDAGRPCAAQRAVAEAVLGAAGLECAEQGGGSGEDVGGGRDALSRAVRAVERENYQVVNVDLTLVGDVDPNERPDDELRERLADRLHVSPGHVSVGPGSSAAPAAGSQPDGTVSAGVTAVALLDRMPPMDRTHSTLRAGG